MQTGALIGVDRAAAQHMIDTGGHPPRRRPGQRRVDLPRQRRGMIGEKGPPTGQRCFDRGRPIGHSRGHLQDAGPPRRGGDPVTLALMEFGHPQLCCEIEPIDCQGP